MINDDDDIQTDTTEYITTPLRRWYNKRHQTLYKSPIIVGLFTAFK